MKTGSDYMGKIAFRGLTPGDRILFNGAQVQVDSVPEVPFVKLVGWVCVTVSCWPVGELIIGFLGEALILNQL